MENINKKSNYRKLKIASVAALCLIQIIFYNNSFAQCKPMIKVDGNATVVNENDDFGLTLPLWLKAGQTLACGSSVSAVSIIEFGADSATASLSFSRVLNISSTSAVAVPSGKVWKIESIIKTNNSSTYKSATFNAGTFTWKVPACAEQICIDMWGGGGGGGGGQNSLPSSGGGGGGGGYGSQCFAVTPGTSYTVVVGAGGSGGSGCNGCSPGTNGTGGGTSSVNGTGISMSATGGGFGTGSTSSTPGSGGSGGTSTASSNAQGANGSNGCSGSCNANCGAGGAGANGGNGGNGVTSCGSAGNAGSAPGGGGSGSGYSGLGGAGASGRVIISW